jgi:hypothetical protein
MAGEWDMADGVNGLTHGRSILRPETDRATPMEVPRLDFGVKVTAARFKDHPRPLSQPLTWMDQRNPGIGILERTNENALRRPAARQANAQQPGREDARVVQDQEITLTKQPREISEATVIDLPGGAAP